MPGLFEPGRLAGNPGASDLESSSTAPSPAFEEYRQDRLGHGTSLSGARPAGITNAGIGWCERSPVHAGSGAALVELTVRLAPGRYKFQALLRSARYKDAKSTSVVRRVGR